MMAFALKGQDGQDMMPELLLCASTFGLDRAAPGRYSMLLLLHFYGGCKSGTVDPWKVVHEIKALEGTGPPSQLKRPTQNKYPPLKGLWHKHYQQNGLRSLAMNIGKALKRYGLPYAQQKVDEAKASGEQRYFSREDINPIINDALHKNFVRLGRDSAVSGEWLVFAKHEGKNYYLCLSTHDLSQHAQVRQTIDAICCREFMFLSSLLANGEGSL
jgi:hypothetical protein